MDKQELLGELEKIKGLLIIVEGKKDKAALEAFGITNIICLSKKPLFEVVEEVVSKAKECAILTDLDKEGKKLFGNLSSNLQRFGIRINNNFRNFLLKNTKLRQIEGLKTYYAKL